MRHRFDNEGEAHPAEPQDLLLDLDDLEDELDGVEALSVHNEQLHRYLREF